MRLVVKASAIDGEIPSSPSKSYTHRAMLMSLLADGRSALRNALLAGDTLATLSAIRQLGAEVTVEGDTCTVRGGELTCPEREIDAENSGTTIRLVAGVASLLPCATVLTGDESIRRRPMQPLIDSLVELGVECRSLQGNGRAPLIVRGPNRGRASHIPGDVSSQFISSLLISSPVKEVDTDIILTTPLKSRPYVQITIDMMKKYAVDCSESREGFRVPGRQKYRPTDYTIPGDYSSAAFPLAAGALAGSVRVRGLDPADRQADRRILDVLRELGASVEVRGKEVTVSCAEMEAADIDLADSPDLFPIVCVLGTRAKGRTIIYNAEHVRFKESDRIRSTTQFLTAMGARVEERPDGCVIEGPCRLRGAEVNSLGDHRILMAATVAGLVAEERTLISDAECYEISYPTFLRDMRSIGAEIEVIA